MLIYNIYVLGVFMTKFGFQFSGKRYNIEMLGYLQCGVEYKMFLISF